METDVVARSRAEATAAREALRKETDRVLADAEKVIGEKIFVRSLDKELKSGINARKHAEYLEREWYEKLGVGTWGAVKEVLMIPVGIGELLVYVSDHGNPVVLLRGGRNDGSKLLYQMSGEDLGAIPEGIANAFEDWWNAAQAEPDRATGQAIGFVGTFFIPVTKLSKVTKLTNIAAKSLANAERLKVAGRFVEAEIELARAQRAARTLAELAEAKTAAQGARAATEEARLAKLARDVEAAVASSQDDLARAALGAKDPFVVAAEAAKSPGRALASAPNHAVFRFDPDAAFGELHHIAAAMEANPTLRIYVSASAENKVVQEAAIKYLKEAFGDARVLTTKAEWKKVDAALQLGLKEGDLQKATGTLRDALARDPKFAAALRERMLGKGGLPAEVKAYVDAKLPPGDKPLLVVWNRTAESAGHGAERAMDPKLLADLVTEAKARGFTPVVMGPKPAQALGEGVVDMTSHWKAVSGVTDQAQMFAYLQKRGAVGQVGMMSGGLDAAAFAGMPTLSITAAGTSDRLGHIVGKLPSYREVTPAEVVGLLKDIPKPVMPKLAPPPPPRAPIPNPLLPGAAKLGESTNGGVAK